MFTKSRMIQSPTHTNPLSRSLAVGLMGHESHGKSSLVRLLSGMDMLSDERDATDQTTTLTDRGEKIFRTQRSTEHPSSPPASLLLPNDISVTWADPSGSLQAIARMLAAVNPPDLVILVVAANEGVTQQTADQFRLCQAFGTQHGLIALTKTDLADDISLSLSYAGIAALTKGTFLENSPVFPINALTGEGADPLRAALAESGSALSAIPRTRKSECPRVLVVEPVSIQDAATAMDCVAVKAVVLSGVVSRGDVLQVHIRNAAHATSNRQVLSVRPAVLVTVRQMYFGDLAVDSVAVGETAIFLIEKAEDPNAPESDSPRPPQSDDNLPVLQTGDSLAKPGSVVASRVFDAALEVFPGSEFADLALRARAPVLVSLRGGAYPAFVSFHDAGDTRAGMQARYARLQLSEPIEALPGDRFVVEAQQGNTALALGSVLDNRPPTLRRQRTASRLRQLAQLRLPAQVHLLVAEMPFGCRAQALVPRLGIPESQILLAAEKQELKLVGIPRTWIIDPERLEFLTVQLQSALTEFHRNHPDLDGMSRGALRREPGTAAPPELVSWILEHDVRFICEADRVRLTQHEPHLSSPEMEAARVIEAIYLRARYVVPHVETVFAETGIGPGIGRNLVQLLLREGKVVKVSPRLLFHKQTLNELVLLLRERQGQRFRIPEFKVWTGVTRKYAVPLLEFLDRQRITRREGDWRMVL